MNAAVLDACVLVPSALCDTLLRLAEDGFYRPLWSRRILQEVEHPILIVRPEVEPARATRLIQLMTETFQDAEVFGAGNRCRPDSICPTRTTDMCLRRRSSAVHRRS